MIRRVVAATALMTLGGGPLVGQQAAFETTTVAYFEDSIWDQKGDRLRLAGGSEWLFGREARLAIPAPSTVLVVVEEREGRSVGNFIVGGRNYVGTLTGGAVRPNDAVRTWVMRRMDEGSVVETADGRSWSVSRYDQHHTRSWLPPYQVLILAGEGRMLNRDDGVRISVRSER